MKLEEIDIVQPELTNSLSLNNRLNNLKTVIESLIRIILILKNR